MYEYYGYGHSLLKFIMTPSKTTLLSRPILGKKVTELLFFLEIKNYLYDIK